MDYVRTEVHLGYLWDYPQAQRTFRLARDNPNTQFIGIDIGKLTRKNKPENLEHKRLDFYSGLVTCQVSTVDLIESVMAFGIYGKTLSAHEPSELIIYTRDVLEIARSCLKPGGAFRIYLPPEDNIILVKANPSSLDYIVDMEDITKFDSAWGKKTIDLFSKMTCYVLTLR